MREVVLDTETTGLDPAAGHRIVEIGCLEIVNRIATGHTFQRYLNPERDVPEEAVRIHGITADKLSGKPLFADVVEELMAFLGESRLVIHNASFDLGFLNAELGRLARSMSAWWAAGKPALP
jgi:DNA polymerase-3 subunit epsilon